MYTSGYNAGDAPDKVQFGNSQELKSPFANLVASCDVDVMGDVSAWICQHWTAAQDVVASDQALAQLVRLSEMFSATLRGIGDDHKRDSAGEAALKAACIYKTMNQFSRQATASDQSAA